MAKKKLNAGSFDRLALFKQPIERRDNFGQDVTIYNTLFTWFVGIDRQVGKEELEANQIQAVNTTNFICRWKREIKEDLIILVEDKAYNIRSIEEIEGRRKYLRLKAERRDSKSVIDY